MRTMLKSKKGISPILATLLLIVIAVAAVIVTYAWVMTFTGSTTSQAGAMLNVENVRFYGSGDNVEIVIRNSGTADAEVAEVYLGTASSDLQKVSSGDIDYDPSSQIISAGSSLEIDIDNAGWASGTRYYFKVVTEEGLSIPFSEEAA
jgi:flagellin-like protein